MISIACRCGHRLSADNGDAGKKVPCPYCGQLITFDPAFSTDQDIDPGRVVTLQETGTAESCPNCEARTTISGSLTQHGRPLMGILFAPDVSGFFSRIFRRRKGVRLTHFHRFHACLTCGHVWSGLSPTELQDYIDQHGNSEARQKLTPFRKDGVDLDWE